MFFNNLDLITATYRPFMFIVITDLFGFISTLMLH